MDEKILYVMLIRPNMMKAYGIEDVPDELARYRVPDGVLECVDADKYIYKSIDIIEAQDLAINSMFVTGCCSVLLTYSFEYCLKIHKTIEFAFEGITNRDIVWFEPLFNNGSFERCYGLIQYNVITYSGKTYMDCINVPNGATPRPNNILLISQINDEHVSDLISAGHHVVSYTSNLCKLMYLITMKTIEYLIDDKFGFNIFEKAHDAGKAGLLFTIDGGWRIIYRKENLVSTILKELMQDTYGLDKITLRGEVNDKIGSGLWVIDKGDKRLTHFRLRAKYDVIDELNALKKGELELKDLTIKRICE